MLLIAFSLIFTLLKLGDIQIFYKNGHLDKYSTQYILYIYSVQKEELY